MNFCFTERGRTRICSGYSKAKTWNTASHRERTFRAGVSPFCMHQISCVKNTPPGHRWYGGGPAGRFTFPLTRSRPFHLRQGPVFRAGHFMILSAIKPALAKAPALCLRPVLPVFSGGNFHRKSTPAGQKCGIIKLKEPRAKTPGAERPKCQNRPGAGRPRAKAGRPPGGPLGAGGPAPKTRPQPFKKGGTNHANHPDRG